MAEIAQQIEEGREVQAVKEMSLETASWLVTKGEGWGVRKYQ